MLNWPLGYIFSFPDNFSEKDLTLLIALLSRIGKPGLAQPIEIPCRDISALTNTANLDTQKIVSKLLQTYPRITATVGEVEPASNSAFAMTGPLFLAASRYCIWGSETDKTLQSDSLILSPNPTIFQHLEHMIGIRSYYDLIHQLMDDYVLVHSGCTEQVRASS